MQQADEDYWRDIDDKIQDTIALLRLRFRNFNQLPSIERIILALNQAYRASGKAADLMDRGHLE